MKGPLGFSAEDLMQETLSMQRKLREGLKLLPGVDDVDYGVTERQEIWRDGKVVLYRFIGEQAPVAKTPLLIVYALVNRPYMVDLQADRSLVKGLLSHGQDVYVLDWGYPDRSERYLTLEDYLLRYIDGAVDRLRAQSGLEAIDVLGICQGGTFSLCYAALQREKVRNLITMVTPVDFSHPRQHAVQLGAHGRRGFVRGYHGQRAGGSDERQLPDAQAFPAQSAEIRGPARHPRRQAGAGRFSAHGKSGSSIRPTSPAKPSANSSRCSTSAMGWSPGRCASVGRQSICRRSTCRC